MARKLSPAQERFLRSVRAAGPEGARTPFVGGRAAANAWYRTAASLQRLGLVVVVRSGDAQRAYLADKK